MAVIKAVLVATVLVWFAGDQLFVSGGFSSSGSKFEDIVMENFVDFLPLVDLAYNHVEPIAHQTIAEYLDYLHNECRKNPKCKATSDISQYLYQLYKKYGELVIKHSAKQAIKLIKVPKMIARFGPKVVLNILRKTASHPLGYAADLSQFVLELFGYDMAGKFVGAGGYILGGALAGFAIGGPSGAVLGGVLGFSIWGIGEYAIPASAPEALVHETL